MYAGIHGIAQGLETLLQSAQLLRDTPQIQFIFVGEGPNKSELVHLAQTMDLPNVRFLPEVPSNKMPAYLSAADCTIVPLRDEPLFRGALPSKMFEAWATARPTVLSVAGEAETVLNEANAGLSCHPEDPAGMAQAIRHLQTHPEEAQQMGERGRDYVLKNYSRQVQAQALETLLEGIIKEGRR
jgi:glycosyltransferase involved in cell wall biosynthesis